MKKNTNGLGFEGQRKKDYTGTTANRNRSCLIIGIFAILAVASVMPLTKKYAKRLVYRSSQPIREATYLIHSQSLKQLFGCENTADGPETRTCMWHRLETLLDGHSLDYFLSQKLGSDVNDRMRLLEELAVLGRTGKYQKQNIEISGKNCHPKCRENGNCNRETGECECRFGYDGEACEIDRLSTCRSAPGAPVSCGHVALKSCACVRQCQAYLCQGPVCDDPFVLFGRMCYVRNGDMLGVLSDSVFDPPSLDEPNVHYFKLMGKSNVTITAKEALVQNDVTMPLHLCPDRCSNRGACMKSGNSPLSPPICKCYRGYQGNSCEIMKDKSCYADCLGRGKCIDRFCHCQQQYWGNGCHRDTVFSPTKRTFPSPILFKIYIYSIPSNLANSRAHWAGFQQHDGNYIGYQYFLHYLLKSPYITQNPEEANLFFIPALTYEYSSNLGNPNPHLNRVIRYIKDKYHYWNNTGGKDHIIWTSGDRGACLLDGDATAAIKLTHYGRYGIQGGKHLCYEPSRDVVVAPPFQDHWKIAQKTYGSVNEFNFTGHEFWKKKKNRILFFAGGILENDRQYSGMARQIMLNESHSWNQSLYDINSGGVPNYADRLESSLFCFCPYGYGWGIRIASAILRGCIPLIIQDGVDQPFQNVLPYEEFSIRLTNDDIPHIPDILGKISDVEIRYLQRGLLRFWPAFVHEVELPNSAFNWTMFALRQRYLNMKSKLIEPLPPV